MQSKIIDLHNIVKYLTQSGWRRDREFPNPKQIVFYRSGMDNEQPELKLVLPSNDTFLDYSYRIESAIKALAEIEDRAAIEILNEIHTQDSDKLELRIVSKDSEDGSLSLNYASKVVHGLKNLVISAACAEENPRPFFRRPTARARTYGDKFRFGQTKVGSFIVTIESNELDNDDVEMYVEDSSFNTAPFARRIMTRIHNSMAQIEKFNTLDNKLNDFINSGYLVGLNANICDALLSLDNDEDKLIMIEAKINYSKLFPTQNEWTAETISINKDDFQIIKLVADAFRQQEQEIMRIEGKVTRLSTKLDSDNTGFGIITIDYVEDNIHRSVKVELDEAKYKVACDAHKFGKTVQVVGVLDFSHRSREIIDLHKFSLLD